MSWTFSIAMIRGVGTPAKTRQALLRALKRQYGYVPAEEAEPTAGARLYMKRGSGWLSMVSDDLLLGEDPDAECETLRRLAAVYVYPVVFCVYSVCFYAYSVRFYA